MFFWATSCLVAGPISYVYSSANQFGTVDLSTGVFHQIGTPNTLLEDIAANGTRPVYGIDTGVVSTLVTVDTMDGTTVTPVGGSGNTGAALLGIEENAQGALYGQSSTSLYRLDLTTGAATLVGEFGANLAFDFVEGSFNSGGNLLAVGHVPGGSETSLYRIDPRSGQASLVNPNGAIVQSLIFANDVLYGFVDNLDGTGRIVIVNGDGSLTNGPRQDPALAPVLGTGALTETPEPGGAFLVSAGLSGCILFRARWRGRRR